MGSARLRIGLRSLVGALAAALFLSVSPGNAPASWIVDGKTRVWTVHYRTHDGYRSTAYVLLPAWYGPDNNPPIPLIISPHGRGVSGRANINRWGNLPAEGPFAVVNPDGHGRRLRLYSWGYRGQIDDLARMRRIVTYTLPWLRIDRDRTYAFGASMGGQETLLLAARHPWLLAGAAAFDSVSDLSRRYYDFPRLPCNWVCLARWNGPIGISMQAVARREIGGSPANARKAYDKRSPMSYVRQLASGRVPLQVWWSTADRVVVDQRRQSARFLQAVLRKNPDAPVQGFSGNWRHSMEMASQAMLIPALQHFGLLPAPASRRLLRLNPPRKVNRQLPWHNAILDDQGKLLAWYRPKAGLGYDRVLGLGWNFIERRVPVDRHAGVKVHLAYAVFNERTLQGGYWQHNPAFLFSSFVDSLIGWYPYSGDRRAITTVRQMLDYQLAHGTTPARWAWPRVPFASSCAGDRTYGRCLAGMPKAFYGGIEPDKVALLGLGYLHFYELTGERRYLRAAVSAGNALARHVREGDAGRTPWPFRVNARTGAVLDGAQYGGLIVAPVQLFDELVRLRVGNGSAYRRARTLAWTWILEHPLNPRSAAWNRWSGFYEDVPYNPASRNQVPPTLTAQYLLTRDDPASADPLWRTHVESMLEWVRASLGRGAFLGAWGIDEQFARGRPGCCSRAGLGSTTSRWAAMNALLYARTGDERAREQAFRSLNYATYFAASDGRIACCGKRPQNTYWFSDGYGDYLRSFNWAMAAVPEFAPKRQNHLLGSSSVVQAVSYGRLGVGYRTFDPRSVEVLRLAYRPAAVHAGSRALPLMETLTEEGYTVRPLGGGDYVVRIRHEQARSIHVSRG
jgi:pimeloyl-ACP methyl ester carboxylesterase